jgi:DNA polymerase-3 subunit gamma/tau
VTYIPLHHKYRPQTFTQLVGQDAIATTLSNALLQNRIAPAYLFTGARGTGKTSSARIFAKSLNCIASDSPTDHPCGVCDTCRAIVNGSALDVIEIDAASNTGVDNIRELIERAQFAPVQCRYKVYVIDEVHSLSTAAFNALLKTLEEPPDRVVFILATTDPQRVLPTIISRCQRFDFRRIPLSAMVQHLGAIAAKESIPITEEALHLIAQISQGGLRDAESLLDQLSLLVGEITTERVWDLVGAVPERDLMALIEAIASDNPETVLDTTRRLMDRGREPLIVLQNLASFYRDLLIAKTARDRGDLVALTPPTWAQLCEFAQGLNISTILAGQKQLKDSEAQLKTTTQPRLWLEVTLLGLLPSAVTTQPSVNAAVVAPVNKAPLPNALSVDAPSKDVAVNAAPLATDLETPLVKDGIKEIPTEPEQKESLSEFVSAGSGSPNSAQAELENAWQQILSNIDLAPTRGIVGANCYLYAMTESDVTVAVRGEHMVKMIQRMLPQIRQAVAKTIKATVRVSLHVGEVHPVEVSSEFQGASIASRNEAPAPLPHSFGNLDRSESSKEPSEKTSESFSPGNAIEEATLPHEDRQHSEEFFYHPQNWQDDPVLEAAKSLAYVFNGAIVDLEDDSPKTDLEIESISVEEQLASLHSSEAEGLDDEEDNVDF